MIYIRELRHFLPLAIVSVPLAVNAIEQRSAAAPWLASASSAAATIDTATNAEHERLHGHRVARVDEHEADRQWDVDNRCEHQEHAGSRAPRASHTPAMSSAEKLRDTITSDAVLHGAGAAELIRRALVLDCRQ